MKLLDHIEKGGPVDIEYYLSKSETGKIVTIKDEKGGKDGNEINIIYQRDKKDLLVNFSGPLAIMYEQVEQWEGLFAIISNDDFNNNEDVFNLWIDREVVLGTFVTKKGKQKIEPIYVGSHRDDLVYFPGVYGSSVKEILGYKLWRFIDIKKGKQMKKDEVKLKNGDTCDADLAVKLQTIKDDKLFLKFKWYKKPFYRVFGGEEVFSLLTKILILVTLVIAMVAVK